MRRSEKLASARPPERSPWAAGAWKTWVSGRSATPRSRQIVASRRRDGEAAGEAGRLLAGPQHLGLDAAEQAAAALGLAPVREGDDDVEALAKQAMQLVLRLGEAARDQRGPLRVEQYAWPLRERVPPGGAPRGRGSSNPSSARRRAPPPGCQTKSGGCVSTGTRSPGTIEARLVVVRERDLGRVGEPLGRRVDRRLVDLAERALRERREGADALDLVAEQLDAERLAAGARKHIDEPTAHGDLATLFDALHALVSGERELLGE